MTRAQEISQYIAVQARMPILQSWPVSEARANAVLPRRIARQIHGDAAPALVRIGLWVVGDGIGVRQLGPDRVEGLVLLLPGLGEVGLASRPRRDAAKDVTGDGVLIHLA